jgi:hypothetical protein
MRLPRPDYIGTRNDTPFCRCEVVESQTKQSRGLPRFARNDKLEFIEFFGFIELVEFIKFIEINRDGWRYIEIS